jgi:hypothetical protein
VYGVLNLDGTMDRNKIVHITYRPSTQEEKNALWMMDPLDAIGEDEEVVPATPPDYNRLLREGRTRFFFPETPPKPTPLSVPEIKLGTRVLSYEDFVQAINKNTETIPETPPKSRKIRARSGTPYNPKSILRTATGPIPIPLPNRNRKHTVACQCNCPIACICSL